MCLIIAASFTGCKSDPKTDPGQSGNIVDSGNNGTGDSSNAGNTSTDGQNSPDTGNTPAAEARTAEEIVAAMTVGWNLGNTMDSHGNGNSLSDETYWGNPKTTQAMIDAVSQQGFNTVRIPVTWSEHLGPAPDYKIDEKWMERVAEIVDYCINDNMFVIVNTHHETEFWLKADGDQQALCDELSAIWKQIAERFKDYDDKLIFEGMNEPRTKGSAQEWNGGTYEERKTIDAMNQAFYKTVREAGGNNATRSLMLCSYGHSANSGALSAITIPEDDPYIIIAVHAYTPYFFTYDAQGGYSNWDSSQVGDIKSLASDLNIKFRLGKIPVVITEFGCVNKKNSEDIIRWVNDYMGLMNKYGIKCIWWDNGLYTSNGENFGLLNRKTLKWFDQNLADAIVANGKAAQ